MSRSRAIWCEVSGTGRKNEPKFGGDEQLEFKISVGSAKNSNHFVTLTIERAGMECCFRLLMDNNSYKYINVANGETIGIEDYITWRVNDASDM